MYRPAKVAANGRAISWGKIGQAGQERIVAIDVLQVQREKEGTRANDRPKDEQADHCPNKRRVLKQAERNKGVFGSPLQCDEEEEKRRASRRSTRAYAAKIRTLDRSRTECT